MAQLNRVYQVVVRRQKLMPIVFTLCVVGSYAISGRLFDVGVMVILLIIGYYLRVVVVTVFVIVSRMKWFAFMMGRLRELVTAPFLRKTGT